MTVGHAVVAMRAAKDHHQQEPHSPREPKVDKLEKLRSSLSDVEAPPEIKQPSSFIDSKWFISIVYATIIINGAVMGLSIDYTGGAYDTVWKAFEHFFTIMFILEAICKLYVLRLQYFHDNWNNVDAALVVMSIVDVWILPSLAGGGGGLRNFSVLRLIKILRVVKLIRFFKMFKQLWVIVVGIFNSFQTMGWVCLLLFIFIYICAIACTTIIGHDDENYRGYNEDVEEENSVAKFNNYQFFGTIPRSMYTLFCVVLLAEYPEIGRSVVEAQPLMILFFMGFIVITSFGVMNVIIGVIVDNTMEAAKSLEKEEDAMDKERRLDMLKQIAEAIFKLDLDGGGSISLKELKEGMADPHVRDLMKSAQVPNNFEADDILLLLDSDGCGEVSHDEFISGFYDMLMNDPFQKECTMTMKIHRVQRSVEKIDQRVEKVAALMPTLIGHLAPAQGPHRALDSMTTNRVSAICCPTTPTTSNAPSRTSSCASKLTCGLPIEFGHEEIYLPPAPAHEEMIKGIHPDEEMINDSVSMKAVMSQLLILNKQMLEVSSAVKSIESRMDLQSRMSTATTVVEEHHVRRTQNAK